MKQIKIGNGTLINGDNLEVMKQYEDNYFDNCISDFPYDLKFMGKKWDTYSNFYEWCKQRAEGLHRIVKHGGYVLIFGHHKTNHRMKCAFEDAGFKIVEEIDWVYSTGFPKNQDIGKLFDKANETELAEKFNGWKTSGLKPAKEIITVFQKPLQGKYIDNIKEYGVGAMNIDACRIEYKNQADLDLVKAKCNFTENSKSIGFGTADSLYGTGSTPLTQARDCVHNEGRFPANIIFDTCMGQELDNQSGLLKSGAIKKGQPAGTDWKSGDISHERNGGRRVQPKDIPASEGGASRFFLNIDSDDYTPFLYCAKPTKKEKGDYCNHITVKPKKLIKWLIKLVTPIDGKSLDITAGSGTHGLSCEELNREGYNIEWIDIEMMNTEDEPYFEIAKKRISESIK